MFAKTLLALLLIFVLDNITSYVHLSSSGIINYRYVHMNINLYPRSFGRAVSILAFQADDPGSKRDVALISLLRMYVAEGLHALQHTVNRQSFSGAYKGLK